MRAVLPPGGQQAKTSLGEVYGKWSHDAQDQRGDPIEILFCWVKKRLELAVRFFEENSTRRALPESFIVGLCLIFELELDIDSASKVLMETWSMFNID